MVNLSMHSARSSPMLQNSPRLCQRRQASGRGLPDIRSPREKRKKERVRFWYPMPGPILFYATPGKKQLLGKENRCAERSQGGS